MEHKFVLLNQYLTLKQKISKFFKELGTPMTLKRISDDFYNTIN